MTTPGGGGTGNLGGINFLIKVGTAAFKKGLNGAEQTAKKTTGKIGGFFGKMQGRFQGAAGKIPIVGSARSLSWQRRRAGRNLSHRRPRGRAGCLNQILCLHRR